MIRLTIVALALVAAPAAFALSPMEELGKSIFFDTKLSSPAGQSCASCHAPEAGFTSPSSTINATGAVVPGAISRRFGNRRSPTVPYASLATPFEVISGRNGLTPSGGMFWDGRATGDTVTMEIFPTYWSAEVFAAMSEHIGPAADQAMGPFFNEVEQNIYDSKALCRLLANSTYSSLWRDAWGATVRCRNTQEADLAHQRAAFAIAVWERSGEVNSFSSEYDLAIATAIINDGEASLPLQEFTEAENTGMELFFSPQVGCARFCHAASVQSSGLLPGELFANPAARYFNIGMPRNPANPFYRMDRTKDDKNQVINPLGRKYVDLGIGGLDVDGVTGADFVGEEGKFKTPTLRNVGKIPFEGFVKAYGHNGYFKSLEQMIHFYNTRDVKPVCLTASGAIDSFVSADAAIARGCWPDPEVLSTNIFDCNAGQGCKVPLAAGETFDTYCDTATNPRGIGNLCLSEEEEAAIVAFMHTLTDQAEIVAP